MNEVELGNSRPGQREWIEIRLAHTAREFVQNSRQLQPRVREYQESARFFRVVFAKSVWRERIERHGYGVGRKPETHGSAPTIQHVHIEGPCLRPILPRVDTGVGADLIQRPVRLRSMLIVMRQRGCIIHPLVAEKGSPAI